MEVVHSLTSVSCILAFRRFVARRGAPTDVFSDRGTNFVGADKILKSQIRQITETNALTFTNTRTTWHFNPPAAPHMGGAWERMVRSVKEDMKVIADCQIHPNDETLETFILEAEAIVNARPLTYVPLENADQEAITPNHFLLRGSECIKLPSTDCQFPKTLRDSWNIAQVMTNMFWRRWLIEYIPMLTRRAKWFDAVKPLEQGDIVIILDETSRNSWTKGRVVKTFPGADGQVRRALVQTNTGIFERPTVRLAVLDVKGKSGSREKHVHIDMAARKLVSNRKITGQEPITPKTNCVFTPHPLANIV
ncbi:uncharacterized protein LOC129737610 [Uranotaenia lowii]|uniref:uncharacterized protein LOC129737610 n=1 Tax=Uranotaenia lowii TaxID=190385 RepID=UPI002479FBDB|nr:uncharacterized protein LOC129737610 [Uranotaenia lowii]